MLGFGAVRPVLDPDEDAIKVEDRGTAGEWSTDDGGTLDAHGSGFGEDQLLQSLRALRSGQDVQDVCRPALFMTAGVTHASRAPAASAAVIT